MDDIFDEPGPSCLDSTVLTQMSTQQLEDGTQLPNISYEASTLIEEIEEEIQKDQQGVSDEDILHKILLKLEKSIINEVYILNNIFY